MSRRMLEHGRAGCEDALETRDRFYREAAAGHVPAALRNNLVADVVIMHDAVGRFQPAGVDDERPDISHVEAAFEGGFDAEDADPAECVELIDELDRIARKYDYGVNQ